MQRHIRFPANLICLSAFLLLGFSNPVKTTLVTLPSLSVAVPEAGTVAVTGTVLFPNRRGDMRPVSRVRVNLYDYEWTVMSPQYIWLAQTYTDNNGAFAFPPITNYDYWDSGDPDTRLDLFIVVEAVARESGSSYSQVTYFNGALYKWNEPGPCWNCYPTGLWWDVPDGTITMDYSIDSADPNRPAMWLLRDAGRSWDYVNTYTWSDPGSTTLTWQNNQNCYPWAVDGLNVCNSFFSGPLGTFIFVRDDTRISRDVVIHEIGHNYMYNVTPSHYWYNSSSCYQHDIWTATEARCGWSEGWADFFPLLVNGDRCYDRGLGPCTGTRNVDYFDLEYQGWGDGHPAGQTVEGRVAGALYDLYDSNNEGPFDVATNSFESIWIIMRDRIPTAQTLSDFGDSWKNTGYNYMQFLLVSYQNTIDYGLLRWNYLPLIIK